MHIVLMTDYFPPEVGGAAHLMADLASGLAGRGHRVTVATGMPRYNLPRVPKPYRGKLRVRERQGEVEVIRTLGLPTYGRLPLVRGLSHLFSGLSHFLSAFSAPKPDVVFALSPPLPEGVAAHFVRRLRGGAFVLNVQDIFPQNAIDLGLIRNPLIIRFFEAMERFVYRHADAIVVHSEGNRRFLIERKGVPAHKVHTIPNWVNTDSIRPGPKENEFRKRHGLEGRFVVTFAGVMGWSQGLDVVLEAAQRLLDEPRIVFLMVGEGVEKARLQRRAKELGLKNVRFLPLQPREEYAKMMQASDVGLVTLHPNVATPVVPSKILSIMAAGRPVVASLPLDGDGPRLIKEARCGICVPPGDPAALAEAIRRLASDVSLRDQLEQNGRQAAETMYSLKVCITRYEDLFNKLTCCS